MGVLYLAVLPQVGAVLVSVVPCPFRLVLSRVKLDTHSHKDPAQSQRFTRVHKATIGDIG